jgi:hypothetical protein
MAVSPNQTFSIAILVTECWDFIAENFVGGDRVDEL